MTLHYSDDAVTLHHGDCLDVLAALPDASVDAVVTDPPYSLSFMGRAWDSHETPFGFQQWCEQWAAQCLRVLKPGGHMLAFGGTRTWHRLACAVEDAGFEVRDSIAWLYGCLTDDVEVLTPTGWRRGIELAEGDDVAQWNPTDGAISVAAVKRTYRAPWDGPLVRFRNSDTDQALTPNHRVWHRRNLHRRKAGRTWHEWSYYKVAEASTISRRSPVRLPLAGWHDGPGIGGTDYAALLGWVWTEGGFDNTGTGVRVFQSSVNADHCDEIAALLDRLGPHKRYDYERTWKGRAYTASTWFMSGDLANRVRSDLPGKHPTFELLFRMTADEKEAFYDAAVKGDGHVTARGAVTLEQKDTADRAWFVTLLALIGKRGHDYTRTARDGGSVSVSQRADTTLGPRALADAHEDYTGDVWCISVPTGAFVARRHGKVFITGNSGFPKSLDVSKAIDKQRTEDLAPAAAVAKWLVDHMNERMVTRRDISTHFGMANAAQQWTTHWTDGAVKPRVPTVEQWLELRRWLDLPDDMDAEVWRLNGRKGKPGDNFDAREVLSERVAVVEGGKGGWSDLVNSGRFKPGEKVIQETAPATPAAQQWQGWGTALKPAFEPIVVARKPLQGTVAANVLAFGTGALNVDGCRVGTGEDRSTGGNQGSAPQPMSWGEQTGRERPTGGRWPANVLLDGSQAAVLDAEAGPSVSRIGKPRGAAAGDGWGMTATGAEYADEGGPSRFFPTFRYEAKAPTFERPRDGDTAHPTVKPLDLLRWLVRLVTPPGGVVLDPFAGTGTTGEACIVEGVRAVLIEREADYLPLIVARLSKPIQPDLFGIDGESA